MTDSTLQPRQRIAQLEAQLQFCMYADRHKLRRRLNQARTAIDQGKQDAGVLGAIARQIAASSAKRETREQNLPKPDYPAELPVSMRKDEIEELSLPEPTASGDVPR